MTDAEGALLDQRAAEAGLGLSEWIRATLLGDATAPDGRKGRAAARKRAPES